MAIDRKLRWFQEAGDFDDAQKKILMGLSSKKWLWRTFESLRMVTRLSVDELGASLDELLDQGLVKGSVSRNTCDPIFVRTERVGGHNTVKQQR